ncbi:MAG TPA: DUF3343 domain-containing protein [Clostridiales bacterium]|nr:DUF3343 domain-containing protein [Clostridiales bacterium]
MVSYLIICRSLTHAQRTARVLERAGISAIVMRPPVSIPEKGCVYCVKISEKRLREALIALNNAGMSHGKIYILYADGTGAEVKP